MGCSGRVARFTGPLCSCTHQWGAAWAHHAPPDQVLATPACVLVCRLDATRGPCMQPGALRAGSSCRCCPQGPLGQPRALSRQRVPVLPPGALGQPRALSRRRVPLPPACAAAPRGTGLSGGLARWYCEVVLRSGTAIIAIVICGLLHHGCALCCMGVHGWTPVSLLCTRPETSPARFQACWNLPESPADVGPSPGLAQSCCICLL